MSHCSPRLFWFYSYWSISLTCPWSISRRCHPPWHTLPMSRFRWVSHRRQIMKQRCRMACLWRNHPVLGCLGQQCRAVTRGSKSTWLPPFSSGRMWHRSRRCKIWAAQCIARCRRGRRCLPSLRTIFGLMAVVDSSDMVSTPYDKGSRTTDSGLKWMLPWQIQQRHSSIPYYIYLFRLSSFNTWSCRNPTCISGFPWVWDWWWW